MLSTRVNDLPGSFDNTGSVPCNANNQSRRFPEFEPYSPLFLSYVSATQRNHCVFNSLTHRLSFASVTATLSHPLCFYGKQIWTHARKSIHERSNIHARLMSQYSSGVVWHYHFRWATTIALGFSKWNFTFIMMVPSLKVTYFSVYICHSNWLD